MIGSVEGWMTYRVLTVLNLPRTVPVSNTRVYHRRGGFDTARELWKDARGSPAYSTTGLGAYLPIQGS